MVLRPRQHIGSYRIERCLARGGFADVYRAYDRRTREHVALKLPLDGLRDVAVVASLQREADAAARLRHPSILPITRAEPIGGHFVMVMPLGVEDLAQRMKRRLAPRAASAFARQLLEALAFAHGHGIAHLDVKPQNAILFSGGRLCLSDFGLARRLRRPRECSGSGTIGYFAPEQALGRPSLRSDVFAAGLVIWELLCKQLPHWPFDWPHAGASRLRREYGGAVAAVLRRATRVREEERYRDSAEMLHAFVRAVRCAPANGRAPPAAC